MHHYSLPERPMRLLTIMLVALVLSLVYGLTLVPGVTWAHHGADSGDLLTAVATGGVPHPTGYPSYLLLMDGFRWLPLGDLALQQAIFSALCAILSALLVVQLVLTLSPLQGWQSAVAAGFAALWLGFTPLFWSQAVIVEVYSLHALCSALLWWWAAGWCVPPTHHDRMALPSAQQVGLAGLSAGLALGNHLTAAATVVALLLLLVWRCWAVAIRDARGRGREALTSSRPRKIVTWLRTSASNISAYLPWQPVARCLLWLLLGLMVYLLLPVRAGATPASWGDPRSIEGLVWLVSGQLYHHMALQPLERPLSYALELLYAQMGSLGLGLALAGLLLVPMRTAAPLRLAMLLVALVTLAFAVGYRSHDAQVYLLPVLLLGAVGVGVAVAWVLVVSQKIARITPSILLVLLLVLLLLRLTSPWPAMRAARHDQAAAQFSATLLAQAPTGAIIFTREDRDSFPLWYAHYGQGQRPDLVLVVTPLLPYDWYRANLRRYYPDLVLPHGLGSGWDMALIAQNPTRPPCWVVQVASGELRSMTRGCEEARR
ncbi:protein O-mannosyl-transferase family [Candidatus Viridilinea mediisalina]|uniref:DUF2723 domain-containing protein n=1 Tax=Candidatus Viridilinea mediisalina TaxID=2024553 RepID=A0A2A6RMR9_9CHLR|nr:DUF2723 domain-containing protein [Candidatus Viridilinea mediisalina]PDW04216.1 hypothetical protein CJ255_04500 [Candidatus Viridilinea mediisalina]